jgi:beta-lactamase class A
MAYLFSASDKGAIDLGERLRFGESDKLPGAGVLQWLKPNSYTMWNLCRMMISISDNTATRLLVLRLGKKKVNAFCSKIGLKNTRLVDPTALAESPKKNINITTPDDTAKLLFKIEKGIGFSKRSKREMLSFMKDQKYRFGIPFVLPRGFICANKTGNLERVLHDAAIVYSPKGTYVLCVFTKGFKRDRNARIVINRISAIVAKYYI